MVNMGGIRREDCDTVVYGDCSYEYSKPKRNLISRSYVDGGGYAAAGIEISSDVD